MKKALIFLLVLLPLAYARGEGRISVAAAANISAVAPALDAAFSREYAGRHTEFTFGSSGTLVTQILHGAPFQVFLSADVDFAQKLVDAGQAAGPVKVYAIGTLVLLTTKKRDLSRGLAVLLDPSIEKIAITNPDTAPYGRAAREALINAGLFDAVKSRIVTAQNVNQTLQFTLTGADAGFVAGSSLHSPELQPYDRKGEFWIPVDPAMYNPIRQGFVIMRSAASLPDVAAFAAFLTSPEARTVFASFGYGAP